MNLSELVPNPNNPRKITDKKLEMLKKSLGEFGDLSGIVFNKRTRRLVGGHQRIKVLPPDAEIRMDDGSHGHVIISGDRFSYREVDWDETKEKAANIAANKHGGEFELDLLKDWILDLDSKNIDLDLTGFDRGELDVLLAPIHKQGLTDEDAIPEKVEPRTKRGDLYKLGDHRLLCGDSTKIEDVERLMGGDRAELCFTSPPYSDQRTYGGDKELSTEYLSAFIGAAKSRVNYFAVNLGYSRKDGEVNQYWDRYITEAKNCNLKLLSWNVWDKGECGSIGNQTAMFGISHEWVFIFGSEAKDINRTVKNISAGEWANHNGNRQKDGTIVKQKDRIVGSHSQLKTVFSCSPQKERDEIDHPARFPVRFPLGYIEAMTDAGQSVYDPFGGAGSTLIACQKTGRRCFMMEIDEHYCDVIISRYEQFSGGKAELVEHGKTI